jgi:hypothetical protein
MKVSLMKRSNIGIVYINLQEAYLAWRRGLTLFADSEDQYVCSMGKSRERKLMAQNLTRIKAIDQEIKS